MNKNKKRAISEGKFWRAAKIVDYKFIDIQDAKPDSEKPEVLGFIANDFIYWQETWFVSCVFGYSDDPLHPTDEVNYFRKHLSECM